MTVIQTIVFYWLASSAVLGGFLVGSAALREIVALAGDFWHWLVETLSEY